MSSRDSLKLHNTSPQKLPKNISYVSSDSLPVKINSYQATYFPFLLAKETATEPYCFASSFIDSLSWNKVSANFVFYKNVSKSVNLSDTTARLDTVSQKLEKVTVVKNGTSPVDTAYQSDIKPVIDSLPSISVKPEAFDYHEVANSLLDRLGLQEFVSRDSYILLESHPDLVFGKQSIPVKQVFKPTEVGIPQNRETQNLGFTNFSMLSIGLVFMLVSLKFQFKNVVSIFQSLLSMHEAVRLFNSRSLNFKRFGLLSTFFYLITLTVFSVLVAQRFEKEIIQEYGILLSYIGAFLLFGFLYAIKETGWLVLGNISRNEDLFDELRFNHQLFYTAFALLVFPLQIVASYAEMSISLTFIYVSIGLIIILLIQYILRSLRLFLNYRVSFFFWFLYFCTLEMLPVVMAVYVVGIIGS